MSTLHDHASRAFWTGFFSDLFSTSKDVSSFLLANLELSFKKLIHSLQMNILGTLLVLLQGLDLSYSGIINVISGH